ncbi:glutathione S-transferase isoform A [Chlorella sorokiniana]|uniref:Glutathione S-transferase isoform A n=1 Tax=Chlorella sorokiniana TaxID=3076 RepID=A0A2P6TZS3_CHLSO|nr:glutathione S-transferase isoform A [Chlorella sorokiniana]|eukprot:PRW59564.1 glutathione S-transferase isoform A [Chlorella sorokiniana]
MLSGLARALGGQGGAATTTAPSHQVIQFADNAPSWEELQAAVEAKQKALDAVPPPLETGPASSYALRRTFGQPGEPRVKLYRDHAAWCPYCHKIVLQLEEKQIPYVIEKINMRCYGDKPPEFLRKVPSGLLPVLEVDGQVITESAVIQQVLEQMQPQPAMLPPGGSAERQRAAELMRLERQLFSAWLQWLCNGWGHESNRDNFCKTMDAVEAALGEAEGPYFLADFGLVDITFAPFLERIVSSIAYYKGFRVRGEGRWPNLERWFAAMEARPAYAGFKSDHYTHVHDLPPQLGGCVAVPEAKPFLDAIDGKDGKSWRLPLEPLSATSLEAHTPGEQPEIDRLQAAARLVQNREAVTKFCLRGAPGGKRGPRPVSAPLCDPTAIPALEHWDAADAALRHVAHALLVGVEAKQASPQALAAAGSSGGAGGHDGGNVVGALAYLRDRVCVPRDLKLPAARQFRAHLNWAIDSLQQQRSKSAVSLVEFAWDPTSGLATQQRSPTKPRTMAELEPRGAAAIGGAAACLAGCSPCGVASVAASSVSQPSSATSSLAAQLADLQVASRQSSGSDLGDRGRLLAGLPPGLAAVHTRRASACSVADDASGSGSGEPASPPDSACSPQQVGAIKNFDSVMQRTLTPIKTRSRPGTARQQGADLPPSPPAPLAGSLVSPFGDCPSASSLGSGLRPKLAAGRAVVIRCCTSSAAGGAPNAYNPYDLTAAALSSEFRSPARSSLASPFPSSSRTTSSNVTPSQWLAGSGSHRASAYRALAAQQALTQKDDEPDVYVSVPGVVRRQHSIASAGSGSSVGSSAGPPPPQQAAGGGGEQPPAAQAGGPSAGAPSLQLF